MPVQGVLESLNLVYTDVSAFSSVRVLAADDHAYNREVLRCLLELVGAGADIVVDGEELVCAWSIGCYDLILTDLQMPRLNGMAAASKIRRRERTLGLDRIPIIAITTSADEIPAATFKAHGFDAVLPKPIVPRRLFESILQVLDARTARRKRARPASPEFTQAARR